MAAALRVSDAGVLCCVATGKELGLLTQKQALDKAWRHLASCAEAGPLPVADRAAFFRVWKERRTAHRAA